jgi:glutathione S-transferase
MHAGFAALRQALPMDFQGRGLKYQDSPEVAADIARIVAIWRDCRERQDNGEGPYLFGHFGIADAMFAPVVSRFHSYEIPLEGPPAAYAETVWQHPAMQAWEALCE